MTSYFNKLILSNQVNKIFDFIDNVLKIGDPKKICDVISSHKEYDDKKHYKILQKSLKQNFISFVGNSLLSLEHQRNVIVNQTMKILKCAEVKKINGYLSIGDPGRYIESLKEKLDIDGEIYIAHDKTKLSDVVETGTFFTLGKNIHFDYNKVNKLSIPDESVGLITCYIGLHHFPEPKTVYFIKMLFKILKPGGILILREHDGTNENLPIIYSAHDIYNAITGVTPKGNDEEIRNFKPITYWKKLLTDNGFEIIPKFKLQDGDPTNNYLFGVIKPTKFKQQIPNDIMKEINVNENYYRKLNQTYQTVPEWLVVDIVKEYGNYLQHTPYYVYPYFSVISLFWKVFMKSLKFTYRKCGAGAIFSEYTIANLIIGLTLTIIFIVMAILSFIPNLIYGNTETTKVLCVINNNDNVKTEANDIKLIKKSGSFELLELTRYIPFTNSIIDLALRNVDFIEISGQHNIQVRIKSFDKQKFKNEIYRYRILDTLPYEILLDVKISELKDLIKSSAGTGLIISHIYDY